MSEPVKKKHYVLLVAACYALVAIPLAVSGQFPTDSEAIGFFIGAGLSMMIFPLLTVHFRSNAAGWIVFVVVGFFYLMGALGSQENERTAITSTPFIHQAKNCEFTVTFPSKPVITTYTHPQVGDYEEAHWTGVDPEDSTALRTDCIPVQLGVDATNAKGVLLDQLASFVKNNGLSSVEYRYNLEVAGPTGYVRGVKYIQENPVTYRVAVVAGKNSYISLYAGGLSVTYPQREITPFLNSVRKKN